MCCECEAGGEQGCRTGRPGTHSHALRMCCECVANVLRMCCECVANVLRMCCECVANVFRMCCECVANVLRMCCECEAVKTHFLKKSSLVASTVNYKAKEQGCGTGQRTHVNAHMSTHTFHPTHPPSLPPSFPPSLPPVNAHMSTHTCSKVLSIVAFYSKCIYLLYWRSVVIVSGLYV